MLASTDFWVALSVLAVVAIGLYMGMRPVLKGLDERSERIRKEIDEAERLREDAQRQLADYKRKQREAERECEEIVEHARVEARRMRERAEKDLEEQMARRERLTMDKIAQAEQQAINEVRNRTVEVAMQATEQLIRANLSEQKSNKLIEDAIGDISKRLH